TTCCFRGSGHRRDLHSFPTRRSSDLASRQCRGTRACVPAAFLEPSRYRRCRSTTAVRKSASRRARASHLAVHSATNQGLTCRLRSEEHTSELQSRFDLVCRLLLEKKN